MNKTGSTLVALVAGAALGVGAGMLFAPAKGSKTRKKIKSKAIETKDDLSLRISQIAEELSQTADKKKADFEETLEETLSSMSYKAEDVINTMERKLEDLKAKNAKLQKGKNNVVVTEEVNI
ncbi:Gas vesicle protein [Pustulibacterium marinum]|uniref:Gas vesicle protein n=1 Tax=Pustulibacterium marinum TaxID=1224947 RepID=A0A1I7ETI3_9FLAO|nr:YtxH domain-containing protein [Pustulibacterium marinum]SFU27182.1 Gas vesicle protein [Pustulibacterium marinum]